MGTCYTNEKIKFTLFSCKKKEVRRRGRGRTQGITGKHGTNVKTNQLLNIPTYTQTDNTYPLPSNYIYKHNIHTYISYFFFAVSLLGFYQQLVYIHFPFFFNCVSLLCIYERLQSFFLVLSLFPVLFKFIYHTFSITLFYVTRVLPFYLQKVLSGLIRKCCHLDWVE